MLGNGYDGDGRGRRTAASGSGGRRGRRALAGLCSCCTAGLAGLLVGLATEDTTMEVLSPALFTGLAALLFGGGSLVGGFRR